jgi:hypothetical protein
MELFYILRLKRPKLHPTSSCIQITICSAIDFWQPGADVGRQFKINKREGRKKLML